jgi:hypothetical protein
MFYINKLHVLLLTFFYNLFFCSLPLFLTQCFPSLSLHSPFLPHLPAMDLSSKNLIHQLESNQPKELLNALNMITGLRLDGHRTLIDLGVLPKLATALNNVQQQARLEHASLLVQMAKVICSLVWPFNFDLIGPFWHMLFPSSPI